MTLAIPAHTTPLADKFEYAKALAVAGMIPKAYQQQPANVLVAIELGEALGIPAIVAINEINVINGTPSPGATLMLSLSRRSGHRVRAWNDEDGSGVCEIVRADDPDFTHRARWDEQKARAAGLWGKGHWSKDAPLMMRWRAISECVRLACPEVLGGMKYNEDEAREIAGEYDARPASEPQRVQATVTSIRETVPEPEPAAELQTINPDTVIETMAAAATLDDLNGIAAAIKGRVPDDARADILAMFEARRLELAAANLDGEPIQAEITEAGE